MSTRDPGRPAEGAGSKADEASRRRGASRALDLAGAVLTATSAVLLARLYFRAPIQTFDEGVLLTGAMLVGRGQALYRDFYSNYPPGIFWTIAGLWKVFGTSPVVLRVLGAVLHAGLAALAGRIAGRAAGRRFSMLAAGLVLSWLLRLGTVPYAWLAGLLAAFVFVERLGGATEAGGLGRWLSAGAALGAVSVLRHDLFVYLAMGLVPVAGARALFAGAGGLRRELLRRAGALVAAALSVSAVVWVPTVARAGIVTVAHDLVIDQVRFVMPSRGLPFPDLFALRSTPFGLLLPTLACQVFEGAVALTVAGPVLVALALLAVRRREGRTDSGLVLLGVLAVAVLPQLLGRTDLYHALFTVAPALVAGAVLAELVATGPRVRLAPALGVAACLSLPLAIALPGLFRVRPSVPAPDQPQRYGGLPEESLELWSARREVLSFVAQHGRAGDPLFVGQVDHRHALLSEIDLYFLADRTGATRYMQFDPGLTGREDVQEQMVRDLERSRPVAVVLSRRTLFLEAKAEGEAGAGLLDGYLRSRYRLAGTADPYLLLLRRDGPGAAGALPTPGTEASDRRLTR